MRGRLKSRIGLAAAALIALAAAACGSEPAPALAPAPQAPVASRPAPPATSVPAPQPTASATTPTAPAPVVATSPPSAKVASDVENFVLEELVVTIGTEVTWTNRDTSSHTSTSGSQGSSTGIWDSPVLTKGASYSFTFNELGTFEYFCRIHPRSMNSTITVVPVGALASAQASAEPSPTPEPPTVIPVPPTPTATSVPPTATAVPPTATLQPTATATPPPTATPTPTATPPPTATPTPTGTSEPTPGPVGSNIIDFELGDLTVQVGTTVTWTNLDTAPHTTTAGSPDNVTGVWDSGSSRSEWLNEGDFFSFTFNQVGTFPYFCTIHPFMTATATVVEAGAGPVGDQTATPSPTSTAIAGGGGSY